MNPFLDLLLGLLGSWSPSPKGQALRSYRRWYRRAAQTDDWDLAALVAEMKDRSIPGAYHERPGSMADRLLKGAEGRVPPREVRRAL